MEDEDNENDKNLYKSALLFMNLTSHNGNTAIEVIVENKYENYALNEESKNNSSHKTVVNDLIETVCAGQPGEEPVGVDIQEEFKDIEVVEEENVEEVGSKVTKDADEKDFIEIIKAGEDISKALKILMIIKRKILNKKIGKNRQLVWRMK